MATRAWRALASIVVETSERVIWYRTWLVRPSILSFPVLMTLVLLPACDPPPEAAPEPASAPAEAGPRTAEAKVPPPRAVPVEVIEVIEVKDAAGEPSGAAEPAKPPTPATPAAQAKDRSAPEASSARKAAEARPAKAFTDCRSSEAFADGRCYASREAACEALSCAGKCIHTRSMPPQVVCG